MRRFASAEDLPGLVRDALRAGCRAVAVDRLRGGSKKGVYRVRLDGAGPADPFAPASGLVPFLAAQRSLDGLGVRVPRVHLADDGRRRSSADVAVVEDVSGRPGKGSGGAGRGAAAR